MFSNPMKTRVTVSLDVELAEALERKRGALPRSVFVAGILLFSGSLYALAMTGVKSIGAITPLGGIAFLIGWLVVAWTVATG